MNNCHTCGLARDEGQKIRCGFDPKALLARFPFWPVFFVNARAMPIPKIKVPNKDCPAYKPAKTAQKAKGG